MKRIALLTFLFYLATCVGVACGQEVRIDLPVQTSGPNVPSSAGPLPQALWVANAQVYICAHPSASLSACQASLITTYTDSTGGTPCPTSTQLVQLPGNTCTAATGGTANIGAWYAGGQFDYWVVSSYGTYGPFTANASAGTGAISGQVISTIPLNTNGVSTAINASSGITQTGSGTSTLDTFPGAISSNGGFYQNMGTTANEQVLWGDRVGIGYPVPYVMPAGSAKNIAFDVVPLAGATNVSSSTGVAWIDMCDGNFATPCNLPGTVNYETGRFGIYSTGDVFLTDIAGGTGSIHNLLLENFADGGGNRGNVQIGSQGSTEPAFPLVIAESLVNPAIQLTDSTGSASCYLAKVNNPGAFILGTAAGDGAWRCTGGTLYFGSNSSTPAPALAITPGSLGTVESFGNFLVLDPHGHGSAELYGSADCETLGGTTTVDTGGPATNTALNCLPAYAQILSIGYYITTTITTAASFTVGDSGSATRYSSCWFSGGTQSLAAGSSGVCDAGYYKNGGPALPVRLTFNTTPGAGIIRILVKYQLGVAPTS